MGRKKIQLPSNDMLDTMAADAEKSKCVMPSNEQMQEIGNMANKVSILEEEVATLEDELSKKKKELLDFTTVKMPDLFDEFGLSKLSLTDGTEIEIKRSYSGSIGDDNRKGCFAWLRKFKFDSIIKHQITTTPKKSESKEAKELLKFLKKLGVTYTDKEAIHAATLNAFIKEQIENNPEFPQELFKVYPIRIAKVKLATM